MGKRPEMTLLFQTGQRMSRAEVSGGEVINFTTWDQSSTLPLSEAIELAVNRGGRLGRKVWLLTDAVWLGDIDLPGSAVVGLNDAQLSEAAGYEAEAAGGLAAEQAITAVQRVRIPNADDRFVTAQMDRGEVQNISKVIAKHKSTLAGVLHPAGVPHSLLAMGAGSPSQGGSANTWTRIEFWPEDTILVHSVVGHTTCYPTGAPPNTDWRRAIRVQLKSLNPSGDDELTPISLIAPGVQPTGGPKLRRDGDRPSARWSREETVDDSDDYTYVLNLSNSQLMETFVSQWAQVLSGQSIPTPVLRKPKVATGPLPQILVGVAAALLALTLLGTKYLDGQGRLGELEAAVAHVQEDQEQIKALRDLVGKTQAETRQAKRDTETKTRELEQVVRDYEKRLIAHRDLRSRLASLLDSLSQAGQDSALSGQFALQKIEPQSPTHRIHGVATSSSVATELAHYLADELRGQWRVYPPEIKPISRGPVVVWEFSFLVDPLWKLQGERP